MPRSNLHYFWPHSAACCRCRGHGDAGHEAGGAARGGHRREQLPERRDAKLQVNARDLVCDRPSGAPTRCPSAKGAHRRLHARTQAYRHTDASSGSNTAVWTWQPRSVLLHSQLWPVQRDLNTIGSGQLASAGFGCQSDRETIEEVVWGKSRKTRFSMEGGGHQLERARLPSSSPLGNSFDRLRERSRP